jgi:hypothetical protein
MPEVKWQQGQAWFDRQDEATQRAILGSGKLAAYQAGQFGFGDLVTKTRNPTWGPGLRPTPLSELGKEPAEPERTASGRESELEAELAELEAMAEEARADPTDPSNAGLLSYFDTLKQELSEEQKLNQELWDKLGKTPDNATKADWTRLASKLRSEGLELYKKYTQDGIELTVQEKRNAQDSGYAIVGKEQVMVKQGAFSTKEAQRIEGRMWGTAKNELSDAAGELLQRAGYSEAEIAKADYFQRLKLLEELGSKEVVKNKNGRASRIDEVSADARERTVVGVDYDLAALSANAAVDPLSMPTIDAYGKLELADKIMAQKVGEEPGQEF